MMLIIISIGGAGLIRRVNAKPRDVDQKQKDHERYQRSLSLMIGLWRRLISVKF